PFGVDTGPAAFLDRPAAAALEADSQALGPGRDIYNDWFHGLSGETHVVKEMVPLPSGTRFPMMSSGWGDGGYPVASLSDAEGRMVAIYVDFMGMNEEGDWLLPPECPAPQAVRLEMPAFPPFNPAASGVWYRRSAGSPPAPAPWAGMDRRHLPWSSISSRASSSTSYPGSTIPATRWSGASTGADRRSRWAPS